MNRDLLDEARRLAQAKSGPRVGFYVPGMFVYDGRRGRYPALSTTGGECELSCLHCQGRLLKSMVAAAEPKDLVAAARRAERAGNVGLLISGGCDSKGRLPWEKHAPAIEKIKTETDLFVSVHTGFADLKQARALKAAGVDLALIDVIGDAETMKAVYGLDSPELAADSLQALTEAGLAVAPHVVVGLHRGRLKGEERAVEMIAAAGIDRVVFVVFMPLSGTPLADCQPPPAEEVARLMARSRLSHPDLIQHLGCAKPRGAYHRRLDRLGVMAGVNHLAIPAPEAVDLAEEMGLAIDWAETCCALGRRALALKNDA